MSTTALPSLPTNASVARSRSGKSRSRNPVAAALNAAPAALNAAALNAAALNAAALNAAALNAAALNAAALNATALNAAAPLVVASPNNNFNRSRKILRYSTLTVLAGIGALYLMGKDPLGAKELIKKASISLPVTGNAINNAASAWRGFRKGGKRRKTMKNKRRSH